MGLMEQFARFLGNVVDSRRAEIDAALAGCAAKHPEIVYVRWYLGYDHDGELTINLRVTFSDDCSIGRMLKLEHGEIRNSLGAFEDMGINIHLNARRFSELAKMKDRAEWKPEKV